VPILALDMYEHAYHVDFGANAKAYVDAFLRNIDWKATQERYEDALKVEPPRPLVQPEFGDLPGVNVEEVKAMLDAGKAVQFIDARPRWRAVEIRSGGGVLVYGFHGGCRTAIALREAGFDAKYMKGGHSGWKALGGPIRMQT
jgi:Fe-Mn family superoxide dismutase